MNSDNLLDTLFQLWNDFTYFNIIIIISEQLEIVQAKNDWTQ